MNRSRLLSSGDLLILLVGHSGSGKTTLAKMMESEGIHVIPSYTTRPPRKPNEYGHTFVTDKERNELKPEDILAYADLYNYSYWATHSQYIGRGTSIYIVTPEAAMEARKNAKYCKVVTIFLGCDEDTRSRRLIARYNKDNGITGDVFNKSAVEYSNHRIEKDRDIFKEVEYDYCINMEKDLEYAREELLEIINKMNEHDFDA